MAASAFIPFPARRININTAPQAHLNGRCGPDPAPALEVKGPNQSRAGSQELVTHSGVPYSTENDRTES